MKKLALSVMLVVTGVFAALHIIAGNTEQATLSVAIMILLKQCGHTP